MNNVSLPTTQNLKAKYDRVQLQNVLLKKRMKQIKLRSARHKKRIVQLETLVTGFKKRLCHRVSDTIIRENVTDLLKELLDLQANFTIYKE